MPCSQSGEMRQLASLVGKPALMCSLLVAWFLPADAASQTPRVVLHNQLLHVVPAPYYEVAGLGHQHATGIHRGVIVKTVYIWSSALGNLSRLAEMHHY